MGQQPAANQVSCFTKVKTGAIMGATLGCGVGLMFGGFVGIRSVTELLPNVYCSIGYM